MVRTALDCLHTMTTIRALVRGLASSFPNCVTSAAPLEPIMLERAHQQHNAYVALLKSLASSVTEVPADDHHPGERWGWSPTCGLASPD